MALCVYLGVMGYNFQKYIIYISMKIYIALADCADADEMPHMHFVWVITISSFEEKKSKTMSALNNRSFFFVFCFFN